MKKIFGIFFIFILVLCANLPIASASSTTPTPGYFCNLTWNIRSIYYYTDSSAQSKYGTSISNAAYNWVYTGYTNALYPNTRTTTQSNSAIDFHTYNVNDGNNGYTEFRRFGTSSTFNPDSIDWDWASISLNDYYLNGKNSTGIQGVVAHEMGHAFGLNHNNMNTSSIMCQESFGRNVYTVQKVDNDAFKLKHP